MRPSGQGAAGAGADTGPDVPRVADPPGEVVSEAGVGAGTDTSGGVFGAAAKAADEDPDTDPDPDAYPDTAPATGESVVVAVGAVSVASASAVVAVRVAGRFTTNAASAPATNRASTETAVPNHVEPSHRPPK